MRRIVIVALTVVFSAMLLPAEAQVPMGGISGTVTDEATGDPLEGICVYGYGPGVLSYWDETDTEGTFEIATTEPGEYVVEFYDCSTHEYVAEYYDDADSYYEADPVQVGVTEPATGIDAALAEYGTISGTVTDELTGDGVDDVCVQAELADGFFYGSSGGWGWSSTDASGSYEISSLRPGDFTVEFYDCESPRRYADEVYPEPVTVESGSTTMEIDAVLSPISQAELPDVEVSDLTVENVALRTDDGTLGYTGWSRRVSVTVTNVGDAAVEWGDLYVDVCPDTIGFCRSLGWEWLDGLGVGESREWTFTWTGLGQVGDVTVEAVAWASDDGDWANNYEGVQHYVLVGGTGFGVGL